MTTIIPISGIISLKDLAEVFNSDPATLDAEFTKFGIPIMRLGKRHHLKYVSLERVHRIMIEGENL